MSKNHRTSKPKGTSSTAGKPKAVISASITSGTISRLFRSITAKLQRLFLIARQRVHKAKTDATPDAIKTSDPVYHYGCGAVSGTIIASRLDSGGYEYPNIQATHLTNETGIGLDSAVSDRDST